MNENKGAYKGSASVQGTGFPLKPLAYANDALEPSLDKLTVEIHHDRHQQNYVNKLNAAIAKHPELYGKNLYDILTDLKDMPADIRTDLINQGGGVYNHEFYWSVLGKHNEQPCGELAEAINRDFGSFESFKEQFKQCGIQVFGSGWVWLVTDSTGKLSIISTLNQDTPISQGKVPILTMDVWEHAYYLKYQQMRAGYLDSLFNVINWQQCNNYYVNR